MIRNNIMIIWRHAKLNRWYAAVKIISLILGLTVFIMVITYINFELSFDRFHKNSKDIYRVIAQVPESYMGKNQVAVTPGILAPTLEKEFPEVLKATRIEKKKVIIENNGQKYSEAGLICVDPRFLEIFSFPLVKGNLKEALQQPFTLLLTERVAKKYFGNNEAIGKILTIDKHLYTIEGILKDPPLNTGVRFDMLTSFATAVSLDGKEIETSWNSWEYFTFVLLMPQCDITRLNEKLLDLRIRNYEEGNQTLLLKPLVGMRHYTQANFELSNTTDRKFLSLLFATGLFILIIACLNYINLATARAQNRSKEIGLRKIAGAGEKQLLLQFLSESVVFSLISSMIALIIVYLIYPFYGVFIGQQLSSGMILNFRTVIVTLIIAVGTGILSGLYPALVISSYQPMAVFKGKMSGLKGSSIRQALVVFQLVVSVIFILGSLVTYRQLQYLKEKDPGFSKEMVLCVRFFDKKAGLMISELKSNSNISDVTVSNQLPSEVGNASFAYWEGKPDDQKSLFYRMETDNRFLDFYNIPYLQIDNSLVQTGGRKSFILNQAAARETGWSEPVGKRFGFEKNDSVNPGVVAGIIRDFNFTSLRLNICPLAISFIDDKEGIARGWLSIKVNPNNLSETLKFIRETWERHFPDAIFEYSFIDDRIRDMYRAEEKLNGSFVVYTLIALFIAGLGLYGLVSFSAERKRKEIGIRKVFGAETNSIVKMSVADFLKLTIIALVIALPAGYILMHNWIKDFAYHIKLSWDLFAISASLAISVVYLTIFIKISKSASANPVDILKYE